MNNSLFNLLETLRSTNQYFGILFETISVEEKLFCVIPFVENEAFKCYKKLRVGDETDYVPVNLFLLNGNWSHFELLPKIRIEKQKNEHWLLHELVQSGIGGTLLEYVKLHEPSDELPF